MGLIFNLCTTICVSIWYGLGHSECFRATNKGAEGILTGYKWKKNESNLTFNLVSQAGSNPCMHSVTIYFDIYIYVIV